MICVTLLMLPHQPGARRLLHVSALELIGYSPALYTHDMGMGREVAHSSYSSFEQPRWGYETNTLVRVGILPSERAVVSSLGNVNAGDEVRPELLVGVVQFQNQTILLGATTQIYKMLRPLLELMTEASRHEEDDFGRPIQRAAYDTIHTTLAEIGILLFATDGRDLSYKSKKCIIY